MNEIKVIRKKDNGLKLLEWLFYFNADANLIVLKEYTMLQREDCSDLFSKDNESTKHWRIHDVNTSNMSEGEIPMPQDVKTEALKLFVDRIRVAENT